jgi:hypothetical protein
LCRSTKYYYNRGYADTPILHACAAYAAILGGKSTWVARLSAVFSNGIPREEVLRVLQAIGYE